MPRDPSHERRANAFKIPSFFVKPEIYFYAKHLETAVFWTGINKDNIKKAKDLLKQLADEMDNHKNIIIDLIKKIREDKNNAF